MTAPTELPEQFNVSTAFLDRNVDEGRGGRVAIYAGDERITYRTLLSQVNRAGNALRALGVRPEERVLLLMLDTPEFAYLFWGAIRIGAVAVPRTRRSSPTPPPTSFRTARRRGSAWAKH